MAKLSALTNQGFFTEDFKANCLINPEMISDQGLQVLNKRDNVANQTNFQDFLQLWLNLVMLRLLGFRLPCLLRKKEKEEATTKKDKIQQKPFDDAYNSHEAGFNHCLRQVLLFCEVSDLSVFDINKEVYHGELVPIDDILEDGAPTPKRLMTPSKDCHTKDDEANDEDNVGIRE